MFGNKSITNVYNSPIIPVIVTIVCLAPFAGKAFHIDDPLFIWSAKHIQKNPVDFYGFNVNWYGIETSMAKVHQNPPAACYYIALVGSLLGFSEFALHIAFLFPAAVAALGTYYLAKQFCSRPALAALAAVVTPAFLNSSTNIMCDTMMLALWVWAMVLWMQGIKANKPASLLFAALLIAICALTKYFGIALLGLLFVYSLMQKRKLGVWVLFLLVPVIILAGYQWATHVLYGFGLLSDAASFATKYRSMGSAQLFSKGLVGLIFTGGCIVTALFYAPLLWSRRVLTTGLVLTISFILALTLVKKIGVFDIPDAGSIRWGLLFQLGLMAAGGASVLALAAADLYKSRNAESLLLLLWIFGTLIFVCFINHFVNARTILPMVPAVGILLMRRIDKSGNTDRQDNFWQAAWPLIPAALISLSVCWADYTWAATARNAAETIHQNYQNYDGTLWFQGHWGFQYYMQAKGHQALDFKYSEPAPADIVIVPSNNTNTEFLSEKLVHLSNIFQFTPSRWVTTMDFSLGAGFYTDEWGPLPFAIGPVSPEKYYAFIFKQQKAE